MNIVQIADKLKEKELAVLGSDEIVEIMNMVNPLLPDDKRLRVQTTGNEMRTTFNELAPAEQQQMLSLTLGPDSANNVLKAIIADEEKEDLINSNITGKWGKIHGAVVVAATLITLFLIQAIVTSQGATPLPEAVLSNVVTQLVQLLINMLTAAAPT